jgi:hypothetical protein
MAMLHVTDAISIEFPDLDREGQPPTADELLMLNNLRFCALRDEMTHWLRAQSTEPSQPEFQAELLRRAARFNYLKAVRDAKLEAEALDLAVDRIRKHLASLDLPVPRNVAEHAAQLVENDPSIRAEAKRRLEARALAATEMARELIAATDFELESL